MKKSYQFEQSFFLFLFPECLKIFLFLSLLFGGLDEVSDSITVQNLLHIEDLVEILLEL